MPLSLRQILLGRNCKILDAFCSIILAAAMQFLFFWTRFQVRREIKQNPKLALNTYKFIFEGMVVMCSICMSLIFFVLALLKYREANRNKEDSQHKFIIIATKVLLFVVGITLVVQICPIMYNLFLPHFRLLAQYLIGLHTWIINLLERL